MFRVRFLLGSTLLASGAIAPGFAQSIPVAPTREMIDSNGVDLFRGTFAVDETVASLGGNQGLRLRRITRGSDSFRNNVEALLQSSGTTFYATVDGRTDRFTLSGSTFTPTEANGSSLTFDTTAQVYTYVDRAGTVVIFDKTLVPAGTNPYGNEGLATTIIEGNGAQLNMTYQEQSYCQSYTGGTCTGGTFTARRLASAKSAYGYMVNVSYASNSLQDGSELASWYSPVDYKLVNLAVDYCDPAQPGCVTTNAWPSQNAPNHVVNSYVSQAGVITGVRRPGSVSNDLTISYSNGKVSAVADHGGTTSYAYADSSGQRTVTVTNALSQASVYTFSLTSERLLSFRDPLNNTTSYTYDPNARLTRITRPEGNYTNYTYDARGNVTEVRQVGKSGSGSPDIITTAVYPVTCDNALTCNQPNSVTDPRGNVTDFTYASGHGGVLTITGPAPVSGGARPQQRFNYIFQQALIKDATGASTSAGQMITLPNRVAQCVTGSTCTTANEVLTLVTYPSSGFHNLQPESISSGRADLAVWATKSFTYDAIGNVVSVDGPLSGTDDTTTAIYDSKRRLIGTISADPDGAGARPRLAERNTFASNGDLTKVEVGTVTGTALTDLQGMTAVQSVDHIYDANGRKIRETLAGGGSTHSVSQFSYDAAGRLSCTAQRMNPSAWGNLPTSACTLGTEGPFGPDRITKPVRDGAGRVTQVEVAVGTPAAATERTLAYTANGAVAHLIDANNNRTTYAYDGHDRLVKTSYPSATLGANASSTTDYEELTLDANGNVTQRRLRDGQTIGYTYDPLNRLTAKNLPGSEPDASYTYDLIGRMTSATQNGVTTGLTWDGLGRLTSETAPQGNVASQYDPAGRRTRVTLPGGGLYADYLYDVLGNVTAIRENGATSGVGVLATYAYDNLSRRTSLTFGNGAVQSFTYDDAARLQGHTTDLAASTSDLSQTFAYNPAGQIKSVTRSNDAYAWTGHVDVSRIYTNNGRNQHTQAGPKTFSYDGRGNLTGDGSVTFGYSSENMLVSASGAASATLSYDPLGRLYQLTSASGITRLGYDGLDRIAEYDGANSILRRYVHGPGLDNPIAWYEGSGTGLRRFLHADERGSVIAVTDSAGAVIGRNSYDDYGIPAASNTGTFGYTGQTWLREVGLWHYKARMYSPTMGRFLQTDPLGYDAGPNLYAYVLNDPVNLVDPLGLEPPITITRCRITNTRCNDPTTDIATVGPDPFTVQPEARDLIVVTGTRPKKEEEESEEYPHYYYLTDVAFCSPSALFDTFRQPNGSGPGSPYAQEGTTLDIPLAGNQPITQIVLPNLLTIINITQEGHRYHSGTVTIFVSPSIVGSRYEITGRGTNVSWSRARENEVAGRAIFRAIGTRNALICSASGIL